MLNKTKFFYAVIATSLIVILFAGCSSEKVSNQNFEDSGISGAVSYPIKTDVQLTYWVPFGGQATSGVTNFSELPFFKELEKKTGIKVKFIHPTESQVNEQFNIMLASGEYPDIIEKDFYSFPGGPDKAINDGYIISLNKIIDNYAPNLKKYLSGNSELDNMIKSSTGDYYTFPFIRSDKSLCVYQGPIIRKDWLDDLGLKVPETIDEWYTTLKAFKEKKGASAPLSFQSYTLSSSGAFVGAYGVKPGLYVEDGKVKYGEMEPGYKDFLATFSKWYQEGLLDKNFITVDGKTLDANILNGTTGATIANTGGGIGKWMNAMSAKDPKYEVVAAPYPTLKKGEIAKFGQLDLPYVPFGSASISTKCKNVDVAARFLDYGYSDEGKMLYNFGLEGISYTMQNGYPKYTELITKNPEGKSMGSMMSKYCRPGGGGPYIQDPRYMEQFASLPQQKKAIEIWSNTGADKTTLPKITLSTSETTEAARIFNELNTYINEMITKFIFGVVPIEEYDEFIEQLKKMETEKYIELYQKAYEGYCN